MNYDILRLVGACVELNQAWEVEEAVDWQEAEDLHNLLSVLASSGDHHVSTQLQKIVEYGKKEEEWDSAYVGGWPVAILTELAPSDRHYSYRETDGERWEVFSTFIDDGEEDWVATVDTESVAIRLCTALYLPWPQDHSSYNSGSNNREILKSWKQKSLWRQSGRWVASFLRWLRRLQRR